MRHAAQLRRIRGELLSYCKKELRFDFDPKRPVVRLHEPTYGGPEVWEALDSLLRTEITMGRKVRKFEEDFSRSLGYKHSMMCNSGSSANLLMLAAIANPATRDRLQPGDEVIVPALTWSTTIWPVIQHGLVPVIVDMDPDTLNMDPNEVERAVGPKTRGLLPVHIYGNPCDMDALTEIARRKSLVLLEDACESLGARYGGRSVGTFGRMATFSFYFSHHITTLEGGMVVTAELGLAELVRILRAHGWVRETQQPGPYLDASPAIDGKFLFVNLGYNLRPADLQGGIGSTQLKRLAAFIKIRARNADYWRRALARFSAFFSFQQTTPKGTHSWFGFPMAVKEGSPFSVLELRTFLGKKGIESRPLNAGNMADQPAMKLYPHRTVGDLRHARNIMKNGFTFGNHQAVNRAAAEYVAEQVSAFVKSKGAA